MTGRAHIPPPIARALRSLESRMRRRFALHGLGWVVAAASALLLADYGLDRLLFLPSIVRIVLLAGIGVILVQGLRRRILYPVSRPFSADDIALLVERGFPELGQELISAVQLDPAAARGDSSSLIAHVQEAAAARIRGLPLATLLRPRRTVRVWSFATGFLGAFVLAALLSPGSFRVWTLRLFGATTPYPRKTFLVLDVPQGQGNYRLTKPGGPGPIRVFLARGADLPVNVDVRGTVPRLVELHVTSERGSRTTRTLTMSRRGKAHFRYVLRRILDPVRLWATGGDDPGTRSVAVTILTPPSATDLSVEVEPPAYTGGAASRHGGGLVEALPGSKVAVRFRSTEPLRRSWLHFQESGRRLPGTAEPDGTDGTDAGGGPTYVVRFDMPAKADRYRLHLVAENGLMQLSPGLHSVVPTPDRKPRLRLLTPGPSLQALTPHAAFPLRFVATDDYGLTRIVLAARVGTGGPVHTKVLWEAAAAGGKEDPDPDPRRRSYLELYSAKDLIPDADRKPREGDRLAVRIGAEDNREPEPQEGPPRSFKIDLLDVEELRRRLQARLRSTRRTVERAHKVQQEQEGRVETFLAEMSEGSTQSESRRMLGLTAAEAGQQRVRGFLLQIRGDLGAVLDAHVFNGLDSSPALADVVAAYLRYYRAHPDLPGTDPGFYAELDASRKAGRIGNLDLIGKLADMFMIAHRILDGAIARSLRSLAAASTADQDRQFHESMKVVQQSQAEIVGGLEDLLRLLEQWNDYQDVVRMTRRIRDAQRDLEDRIRLGR